jgi:hypothetical protein
MVFSWSSKASGLNRLCGFNLWLTRLMSERWACSVKSWRSLGEAGRLCLGQPWRPNACGTLGARGPRGLGATNPESATSSAGGGGGAGSRSRDVGGECEVLPVRFFFFFLECFLLSRERERERERLLPDPEPDGILLTAQNIRGKPLRIPPPGVAFAESFF